MKNNRKFGENSDPDPDKSRPDSQHCSKYLLIFETIFKGELIPYTGDDLRRPCWAMVKISFLLLT